MSTNFEEQLSDPFIYPCLMPPETLSKLPMTAIFTGEFDSFRRDSQNFAQKLASVNRLTDFVIHPGLSHDAPIVGNPNNEQMQNFWKDLTTVIREV